MGSKPIRLVPRSQSGCAVWAVLLIVTPGLIAALGIVGASVRILL